MSLLSSHNMAIISSKISRCLTRFIIVYAILSFIAGTYYFMKSNEIRSYNSSLGNTELVTDVFQKWGEFKRGLISYKRLEGADKAAELKQVLDSSNAFENQWVLFISDEQNVYDATLNAPDVNMSDLFNDLDMFFAALDADFKAQHTLVDSNQNILLSAFDIDAQLSTLKSSLDKKFLENSHTIGHQPRDYLILYLIFLPLILAVIVYFCILRIAKEGANADFGDGFLSGVNARKFEALDVSNDGIIIIDYDGLIDYLNKASINLFISNSEQEKKREEYLRKPWYTLFPKDQQLELKSQILPILDEEGRWRNELTIEQDSGQKLVLDVSFNMLNDGGMVSIVRDVSEYKLAERESAELRKQFFQAQKMESIGRMAGGIAHDFNNILSAIMGYAEFLEEDLPDESMEQSFAKKITAASKQAKNLITQILSFSRKNNGEKMPVDLTHLLQITKDMMESSSPDSIDIRLNSKIKDAYIEGNPTEISQVLMNLCVNARDAMEDKRGKLSLSLTQNMLSGEDIKYFKLSSELDAVPAKSHKTHIVQKSDTHTEVYIGNYRHQGEYFALDITDTGSGILPAIIEQIFEPFFTTKDQDKGTGLGLSSSLGIIVGHQGLMKVNSRIGEGTSFTLYFPVTGILDNEAAQTAVISDKLEKKSDHSKSILLVDDDNTVRETVALMLKRMGYRVTDFAFPLDALEHFKNNSSSYELLMSDYMMPEMKGGELAQKVNQISPNLPIIIISGFAEEAFESSLSDFPYIKAFLRKPLQKEDVQKAFEQINFSL